MKANWMFDNELGQLQFWNMLRAKESWPYTITQEKACGSVEGKHSHMTLTMSSHNEVSNCFRSLDDQSKIWNQTLFELYGL
jgi:hypothetical protein